jgi:circadian clock protein KaiB
MATKATKKSNGKIAEQGRGLAKPEAKMFVLRLCISGMTPRSRQALANLNHICEKYLKGHYQLEVIDLYQQPELAAKLQIIATPTLVKDYPLPLRYLIGNLSDTIQALRRLGVTVTEDGTP